MKRAIIVVVFFAIIIGLALVFMPRIKIGNKKSSSPAPTVQQSGFREFIDLEAPWGHDLAAIDSAAVGEPANLAQYNHEGYKSRQDPQNSHYEIEITALDGAPFDPDQVYDAEPGQEISLEGKINNIETYPLFDLDLLGVFYDDNDLDYSRRTLFKDDFPVLLDFAVPAQASREFKIKYQLPQGARKGQYRLLFSLIQGNSWFFYTMPYLDQVKKFDPRGSVTFQLAGPAKPAVALDRGSMKLSQPEAETKQPLPALDARRYFIDIFSPEQNLEFDIVNNSDQERPVDISYSLIDLSGWQTGEYQYEQQWQETMSNKQTVTIAPQERKIISLGFNLLDYQEKIENFFQDKTTSWQRELPRNYTLKLTIKDQLSQDRTLMFLPLYCIYQNDGHITALFPQITKFPVKQGEEFEIVTGLHDATQEPQNSRLKIELFDRAGGVIGGLDFKGQLDNRRLGWKNTVKAPADINYLRMVMSVYNAEEVPVTRYERIYDCTELGTGACIKQGSSGKLLVSAGLVIVSLLSLLGALYLKLKK